MIVDVRSRPSSRHAPDFARPRLELLCDEAEIGYRWLGATLGGKPEGGPVGPERPGFDESIDEFRRLLELRPNAALAHNNLGALLESRGERAEAIRHYRRALEARPEYTDARFNLGTAMLAQGERDQAIEHFRRTLELAPNFAQAHNNLANALLARSEIDPALEHYRAALRINPELASAKQNLETVLELIAQRELDGPAP